MYGILMNEVQMPSLFTIFNLTVLIAVLIIISINNLYIYIIYF